MNEFKHTCPKCGASFLNRDMVEIIRLKHENEKLITTLNDCKEIKNKLQGLILDVIATLEYKPIINDYKNLFILWDKKLEETLK